MRQACLIAAVVAGLGSISPAAAQARVPLFSCPTDGAGNLLAITGAVGSDGRIGDPLFTAPDGTVWPAAGAGDPRFYMSVSTGGEGDLIEIAFGGAGRQFRLFALTPSGRDTQGRADGGLVVTLPDGTRQRTFTCTERPTIYQGNLHKATECDATTPLGPAACNLLAPPQRTAPLVLP